MFRQNRKAHWVYRQVLLKMPRESVREWANVIAHGNIYTLV